MDFTTSLGVYGLNFVILLLLLFLTALLSGSEVAFFSIGSDERTSIRTSESSQEKTVSKLLDKPRNLLATLLICVNLVTITFVTLATYMTKEIAGDQNANSLAVTLVLLVGITFVITFFGELIPKVWAQKNSLKFAKFTAKFIDIASVVFSPLASVLLGISNIIEKRVERKGYNITADDLNHALEMTGNDATAQEKDILKGIVNFGSTSSKSIMKTRQEITAFDISLNFHELMDKINKSGYSRVPVYRDKIDKIEGILYIKDLLPYIEKDENFNWQALLHQTYFIPENKKIDDLLYDFQEKRVHIAVVVNEYGETEGIITMEDIIEEIVGDIHDESDVKDLGYIRNDDGSFEFEGKISLNDVARVLGLEPDFFDKSKGESESLGGLIIELFGRFPHAAEEIVFEKFRFKILSVDSKKIKKIKINDIIALQSEIIAGN